jgi:hypothetical protein
LENRLNMRKNDRDVKYKLDKKSEAIKGDPSTIAQYATSKGSGVEFISCVDANTKEAVLPKSVTILTQPQGIRNGVRTGGRVDDFV